MPDRFWSWLAKRLPLTFNVVYRLLPTRLRPYQDIGKDFQREYEAHIERMRAKLLTELELSPNVVVVRRDDCPPKTVYFLAPEATGDLAEEPEVRAAFEGGAREVVVVRG